MSETYSIRAKREAELNEQLIKARQTSNEKKYYTLHEKLGLAPDPNDLLYQQGRILVEGFQLEESVLEKKVKETQKPKQKIPRVKKPMKQAAKDFLEEAKRYSSSISDQISEKKKSIITYFPGRFGPNGKQDLDNYEDIRIGSIYNHLVDSYSKQK